MGQAQFPIEVVQGVSYLQPFYYFDESGEIIDLTDCTAQMQARQTVNSDDPPILDWSTSGGEITIDGPAGCVLVSVTAEDTAALEQTVGAIYNLLLIFPSGFVQELVSGPIDIVGSTTR